LSCAPSLMTTNGITTTKSASSCSPWSPRSATTASRNRSVRWPCSCAHSDGAMKCSKPWGGSFARPRSQQEDAAHEPGQFSKFKGCFSKSLPDPQNLKFEREDWSLFRTVDGLQQKAGVSKALLRRLALKELADNGLDLGATIELGESPGGGYFVADNGPGIDGPPEEIARLFSIARPLVSTKLLQLPMRGALGNGLRVVAGCRAGIGRIARCPYQQPLDRTSPRARRRHDGSERVGSQISGRHPGRN